MDELRRACAEVATRARSVRIQTAAIPAYAAGLELAPIEQLGTPEAPPDPVTAASREARAAFWITMDTINFGSGWFPTLRKRDGMSGYRTVAAGLRDRFAAHGPWTAAELQALDPTSAASAFGQDPSHELMGLFATGLNELGRFLEAEHGASFTALVDAAGGSAVALAHRLAQLDGFHDVSPYAELAVPFFKRAQIAAADLARAGVAEFTDLDRLTIFADNLVPHVLRLDGVLSFDAGLVARIDAGELLVHGSPEEVEIRACALHAVELIVAARPGARAADIDELLWTRGGEPVYKASPRHRARCTAY